MLNQEISVKLFDDHSTILFCWPPAGDNANGFVFWRPPSDWRSWSSNWNRLWSRVIRWFLLIGVIIRPAPSDGLNQGKITLFLLGRASGKEGKCWNTVFGGPLWYQFHVKEKVKKISVRQMTGRVPDVACVSINFPMADRPVLRHHHHIGKFLPIFRLFDSHLQLLVTVVWTRQHNRLRSERFNCARLTGHVTAALSLHGPRPNGRNNSRTRLIRHYAVRVHFTAHCRFFV